jgi:hypothetical protein
MGKPFTTIAALLLLVIAVGQAVRAYLGLEVVIDGHQIPITASWIAAAVAGLLSVMLFVEAKR